MIFNILIRTRAKDNPTWDGWCSLAIFSTNFRISPSSKGVSTPFFSLFLPMVLPKRWFLNVLTRIQYSLEVVKTLETTIYHLQGFVWAAHHSNCHSFVSLPWRISSLQSLCPEHWDSMNLDGCDMVSLSWCGVWLFPCAGPLLCRLLILDGPSGAPSVNPIPPTNNLQTHLISNNSQSSFIKRVLSHTPTTNHSHSDQRPHCILITTFVNLRLSLVSN